MLATDFDSFFESSQGDHGETARGARGGGVGEVFACGPFTESDTSGPNGLIEIARLGATEWEQVGVGLEANVLSMVEFNGHLVACGTFQQDGDGNDLDQIAKFDGEVWSKLDSVNGDFTQGGTNPVHVSVFNGQLVVAGTFTTMSGLPANSVRRTAIFDLVTETWSELGGGLSAGTNFVFEEFQSELWMGFNSVIFGAGGQGRGFGFLNGNTWDGQGLGLTRDGVPISGACSALQVFDNELYLGGNFDGINGFTSDSSSPTFEAIAAFDGSSYTDPAGITGIFQPSSASSTMDHLEAHAGALYAVDVPEINSVAIPSVAKWDGLTWTSVQGVSGIPGAERLLSTPDFLLAGGIITAIEGVFNGEGVSRSVALFKNTEWEPLPQGGIGVPDGVGPTSGSVDIKDLVFVESLGS